MYVQPFTVLIEHLQNWALEGGYVFIFLISVVEAIPFLGTVVPGQSTIVVAGFLAKLKLFNLSYVIFVSAVGAIVGDVIGFYLGRKFGINLIYRFKKHFSFYEEQIEKARVMVGRHTGKSLILGRFHPLSRSFVPFLVGASHAPVKRFWFFNVLSGILWAVSSVMIGYVFGYGYEAAAQFIGQAAVLTIIVAIFAVWGYRFVNIRFHIFRKYELFVLAICLVSFWSLFQTIQDAWSAPSFMTSFDVQVNLWIHSHLTIFLQNIGFFVSMAGGTEVTASLALALGLYFAAKRKWRSSFIVIGSMAFTAASTAFLKSFFLRMRPENALDIIINDPSFPSGHASFAATLFFTVIYLFAPKFKSWVHREVFIVLCTILIVAIGLSRVVINVHWASDVVAGWSLGLFCTTVTILLVRYIGALVKKAFTA